MKSSISLKMINLCDKCLHRKGHIDTKACVDKKAARLAAGFHVVAYTANNRTHIELLCKLINSICP